MPIVLKAVAVVTVNVVRICLLLPLPDARVLEYLDSCRNVHVRFDALACSLNGGFRDP
jgi:hypothetical protein